MKNITHIVETIIKEHPFIQEGLSKGIIKHAALAEHLLPAIEKEVRGKVTFAAVNMAIRRLAEELDGAAAAHFRFDPSSDILVQSPVVEVVLHRGDLFEVESRMKKVYDLVDIRQGDILTVTWGLNEVMIITNERHKKAIIDAFPSRSVKKVIARLSAVTVKVPVRATSTPGMFYVATRALLWESVNIIDIVSTMTELTFLVEGKEASRAYETLTALVRG